MIDVKAIIYNQNARFYKSKFEIQQKPTPF